MLPGCVLGVDAQVFFLFFVAWLDKMYLEFTENFEKTFVCQDMYENRTIFETLDRAWELLRSFPKDALNKIPAKLLKKYYQREMMMGSGERKGNGERKSKA